MWQRALKGVAHNKVCIVKEVFVCVYYIMFSFTQLFQGGLDAEIIEPAPFDLPRLDQGNFALNVERP